MVRSHWIGPVFGVLALTGLALGQTATPLIPVAAGEAGEQIVTVQELGKPAQRCKVLKKWTEPGGTHAYAVQALDTGEMMTIEDGPPVTSQTSAGGAFRAVAMRIFHWGRHGDIPPPGTPVPPPDAAVVSQPTDVRPMPMPMPMPAVAVTPTPAPKPPPGWPSAYSQPKSNGSCACEAPGAMKIETSPYAPVPTVSAPAPTLPFRMGQARKDQECPSCQCGPSVTTKMEPVPSASTTVGANPPPPVWPFGIGAAKKVDDGQTCPCAPPVVTKTDPAPYPPVPSIGGWLHPTPVAAAPTIVLPPPPKNPPPATVVTQGPTVQAPGFRLLDPSTWKGPSSPDGNGSKVVADAGAKKPADAGAKAPGVVAKVDAAPAKPGDWRESWGKIDPSKAPPARPDASAMPLTATAPATRPTLTPTPTVAALAPGAPAPKAVVPAVRPDLPPSPPIVAGPSAHPSMLPSPTVVASVTRPDMPPPPPAVAPAPTKPKAPPAVAAQAKPIPSATAVASVKPADLPPAPIPVAAPPTKPGAPPATAAAPAKPNAPPAVAASLPPVPGPSSIDLPHAQVRADDPLKDPAKYTQLPRSEGVFGPTDSLTKTKTPADAKSVVPAGMKSALAASVPNAKAPGAASGPEAAMGFDPNEPNAFSDPKPAVKSGAANAFSEPPPPPPPPRNPQGVDQASNAFVSDDRPAALGAAMPGPPAPRVLDAALPTRMLPPPASPAPTAPLSVNYSTTRQAVIPAGYRPGNTYDLTPMTAVLRESLYPSQREDAAEQLGALDWRQQPEILDILVTTAKEDPAPTVRAECVRSLGRLKANTAPVVTAVKALQSDDDARVRHEADDAYAVLTGATSSH